MFSLINGETRNQGNVMTIISQKCHNCTQIFKLFSNRTGNGAGIMTMDLNTKWSTANAFDRNAGFVCEKKQGDFCPFDLKPHKKSCYDFYLDPFAANVDWDAADEVCRTSGMDMIIVDNKDESNWLNKELAKSGLFNGDQIKGVWLGYWGNQLLHQKGLKQIPIQNDQFLFFQNLKRIPNNSIRLQMMNLWAKATTNSQLNLHSTRPSQTAFILWFVLITRVLFVEMKMAKNGTLILAKALQYH